MALFVEKILITRYEPKKMASRLHNENEILFPSETNPNCSSPKFGEVRGALREPEAVFRHFVMKKSEPKARQFTLEVHGWYNQLKNLSYVHFSLS